MDQRELPSVYEGTAVPLLGKGFEGQLLGPLVERNDGRAPAQDNGVYAGHVSVGYIHRKISYNETEIMDWDSLNWDSLDRLRKFYLNPSSLAGDYWTSEGDLASYDLTFGARIGWKWSAVLEELRFRGWNFQPQNILDWGCGTGVAARSYLKAFPSDTVRVDCWDHSPLARRFAAQKVLEEKLAPAAHAITSLQMGYDLVVVSHVLNELQGPARHTLLSLIRASKAVIWVEPGTHEVSRRLMEVRETLKKDFDIVGPCTTAGPCGMNTEENERHWCHSFATTPSEVFSSADWARFSKQMGVDLRSLPYCYLALQKKGLASPDEKTSESEENWVRIIGEARHYKGYAKVQTCDRQHGVREFILQKRDAPKLLKKLKDLRDPPFFRFEFLGDKIVSKEEPKES